MSTAFILSCLVGIAIGVVVMCICTIASWCDDDNVNKFKK